MDEVKKEETILESKVDSEIVIKREEINNLKAKLKLKKVVFDFIRNGEKDKATKILQENSEILSYFIKFKEEKDERGSSIGKIIFLYLDGWDITYNHYYDNEIIEDLEKLQKELENKENRLEEYIFLKQQQEFISIQKTDLEENKKDRKRMQEFTFILAFGVILSALFNIFQIYVEFKKAKSLHLLILSGIFILLFVLIVIFIFANFNMQNEIKIFIKKQWFAVIVGFIIISIFIYLFMITGDRLIDTNLTCLGSSITTLENQMTNLSETDFTKNKSVLILNNTTIENNNSIKDETNKI